jgi:SAM-dependent methyltransferase
VRRPSVLVPAFLRDRTSTLPAMDAREVFSRIYESDEWRGGSGEGSTVEATSEYRRILERMLGASDVRSVVDVGCGDWQFSGLVDWRDKSYLGIDVVPELVERNAVRASRGFRFLCADARTSEIPRADLLVVKDVLQHWPLADISAFVDRNRRRCRYLLLTNDVASIHCPPELLNSECALGAWRTIDLERAPFAYRPAWRRDFDIRGEWTKRTVLMVAPAHRLSARRRTSALQRVRGLDP